MVLVAAPRDATATPLVVELAPGVTVDWSRGVVTARGVGPADRNAPSPAIARVAARRAAVLAARSRLRAAVSRLATAGGPLDAPAAAARLARELEVAPVVDEEPGTDGSVRVVIAVGTEALRQAAAGPRPAPRDEAPLVAPWIVLAADEAVTPAIGLGLAQGAARWDGAVRYVHAAPADGTTLRATGLAGGRLAVDGALPPAGAAVVVVVRPEP